MALERDYASSMHVCKLSMGAMPAFTALPGKGWDRRCISVVEVRGKQARCSWIQGAKTAQPAANKTSIKIPSRRIRVSGNPPRVN